MPSLKELEDDLRNHPRVQERLGHSRDKAAAEAAVRFFVLGSESPNKNWYASETWRAVAEAFQELAPSENSQWRSTMNEDNGSLKTGDIHLERGDLS